MMHDFSDKKLLTLALTHSSAAKDNNERLEFLGDSLVNFIVGEYLLNKFPKAQEGQLSRMRASLVKGETLAKLAQTLNLSDLMIIGPGEKRGRTSILADAMEALVGAVYLDSNFETCRQCVLRCYGDLLTHITLEQQHVDAKTQLQELLQARRLALPIYTVIAQKGEVHDQVFTVECRVEALNKTTQAQGSNRRQAEQTAAAIMIEKL
ncbi:MAG: ribonuclease III [Pseudomonadota bacterium]